MSNDIGKFEGTDTIQLHFQEEERLRPQDLSDYLNNIKVIYSFLYQRMVEEDIQVVDYEGIEEADFETLQQNREQIISSLQNEIPSQGWGKYNLAHKNLGENDLYINRLEKQSPFGVEFVGILFILLIVVAIGGGNARLRAYPPEAEFEMDKTLGEGLQDIKDVFSDDEDSDE